MNPRARRIRRQRRKDRVRDAEAAKEESDVFVLPNGALAYVRNARESERVRVRREAISGSKMTKADLSPAPRVPPAVQTAAALFAQMARALPKV